jgi:AAA+ superfamily predicted ATPase
MGDDAMISASAVETPALRDLVVPWTHALIDGGDSSEWDEALFDNGQAPLARLARMFGLSRAEIRLVAVSLADELDPTLPARWAQLEMRRGWPRLTLEIATNVCGCGPNEGWATDSALFRWMLIRRHELEPGLTPAVSLDPCIREWLLGRGQLDESLIESCFIQPERAPLDSWPVAETVGAIRRLWEGARGTRIRVLVEGIPGSGRKSFAQSVAGALGMPLIVVRSDAAGKEIWVLVQRQAYLDGCALAWVNPSFTAPLHVAPFPVQFGLVQTGELVSAQDRVVDIKVRIPLPSAEERAALWAAALPGWTVAQIAELAGPHRSTPGDIASVVLQRPQSPSVAGQLLRECSRGRLNSLAQLVECPFAWDDLVVGAQVRDTLEDLAFEAAHRATFWERDEARRMFPQGRGVVALLSGPPGTGKTMAAQVIAAALNLDLYRIDLSAILSKWVGETAQNLERLLREAASLDIVLLFDEADALFGKRSAEIRDAQDRFANMDTGHLLTAIENFPGTVLLTTNLRGNIDPAFVRRVRFIVDFPKPDAGQRLELWKRSVRGLAGKALEQELSPSLAQVADTVEATGAQIKYAVLGGAFRSQRDNTPLQLRHLLHGLNRELSKEGRALPAREVRRLTGEAH